MTRYLVKTTKLSELNSQYFPTDVSVNRDESNEELTMRLKV